MRTQLESALSKEAKLIEELNILNIQHDENLDLKRLEQEIKMLEEVWTVVYDWDEVWINLKYENFWKINVDEMETVVMEIFRKLTKMSKSMKDKNYEILETTRDIVDRFRKTLPLIVSLKNPAMKDRHWKRLINIMEMLLKNIF